MQQSLALSIFALELVLIVLFVTAFWKLFVKAGKPGWHALIPFLNTYQMIKIANKPGWWLLLMFVPVLNFLMTLILAVEFAKAFGKNATYGVVLLWLFPVGYLMLAFGKSTYVYGAPAAPAVNPAPAPTAPVETPAPASETPPAQQ